VGGGGEIRFECLRCGKASEVERLQTVQPRCAKCGARTGVLGDIGQGSLTSRLRRNFRLGTGHDGDINFECLSCGETTRLEKIWVLQPKCTHCGATSGLVVESGPAAGIGIVLACALVAMLNRGA